MQLQRILDAIEEESARNGPPQMEKDTSSELDIEEERARNGPTQTALDKMLPSFLDDPCKVWVRDDESGVAVEFCDIARLNEEGSQDIQQLQFFVLLWCLG